MTKQYKFDFSKMTADTVQAGKNCDSIDDFLSIVRHFYVGDLDALTMTEVMHSLAPAFSKAFGEWMTTISLADAVRLMQGDTNNEPDGIDDDAVRAMLDGIDGLD